MACPSMRKQELQVQGLLALERPLPPHSPLGPRADLLTKSTLGGHSLGMRGAALALLAVL